MSRDILVVVQDCAAGERTLDAAVELAQQAGGRLTILTPVLRPPAWVSTPMTAAACGPLARELECESARMLEAARDRVPADVPLTTILSRRPLREAVCRRLAQHPHDLLVLPPGRATRRLARRSPVPVHLVAPEPPPAVDGTAGLAGAAGADPAAGAEARSPVRPRLGGGRRARSPIAGQPAR